MQLTSLSLALTRAGFLTFSPSSLFTAGEQGVWYDPSDFDRYTAPLGPELVANGTFDTDIAGWTFDGTVGSQSWVAGKLRVVSGSNFARSYTTITTVVGKLYRVRCNSTNVSGVNTGAYIAKADNSAGGLNAVFSTIGAAGDRDLVFTATAVTTYILVGSSTSASTNDFDNISVRELTAIDTATLFQDSAGTTPVTAVEQPVGLMLDKSKGLVLGSELVASNDISAFSTSAGTVTKTNTSFTSTVGGTGVTAAILTVGKWYTVTVQGSSGTEVSLNTADNITPTARTELRVGFGTTRFLADRPIFYIRNAGVGTTNITAVSVRELPGNHAFQTTSTSRPVLSARYNLLTKTEQFDDAAWTKTNVTVSANATVAPDGTQTADALFEQAINGLHRVTEDIATIVGVSYKVSAYLKPNGRTWAVVVAGTAGNGYYFDLQNLTVGSETGGAGTVSNPSITADRNGFVLVSFNVVSTNATRGGIDIFTATGNGQVSFAGDVAKGIYVWGADFRVTNDAAGQPAYQRVNTATDYDTVGFKPYLRFDGTDDWLQTNSINFTGTDKLTVFAGVRKLSDAASGVVAELSATSATNNGSFGLFAPAGAATNFSFQSRGSITVGATATPFAAPITTVATGIGDISGDSVILRVNGAPAASDAADQGTGNYGNYPLYIGRRGGTTLPFNGRIYGLIVRGAQSTAQQITDSEKYMAALVGTSAPAIQGVPTIGVVL